MRIDSLGLTPVTAGRPQVQTKEQMLPKAGDILRAQVVSMNGNTVDLRMPDGTVLSAQGALDTELSKGDNLLLMANKNNGQLKLQILALDRGTAGTSQLQMPQLLAELQKTPAAILTAKILQEMGVTVDSDTLGAALAAVKQFPQIKPSEAAFFIANHIEITQENIQTLNKLMDGATMAGKQLPAMLEILQQEPNPLTGTTAQPKNPVITTQNGVNIQTPIGEATVGADPKALQAAIRAITDTNPQAARVLQQLGLVKEAAILIMQMAQAPEGEAQNMAQAFTTALPGRIPQQARDAIADTLQKAAASWKNSPQTPLPVETPAQAQAPAEAPVQTQQTPFTAKDVTAKILALFARLEGNGEDGKSLKEAAAGTERKLLDLKDALINSTLTSKGDLTAKTDQLISQSRLMADNSLFTYIQIPVTVNQRSEAAELFVYKRSRKGKRLDPENAVILIGLDTQNMGRVETMIRVEKRSVYLQFKTEMDGAAESIRQNTFKLQEMLGEIGYQLAHTRITKLHEKTTPLNAAQTMVENSRRTASFVDLRI